MTGPYKALRFVYRIKRLAELAVGWLWNRRFGACARKGDRIDLRLRRLLPSTRAPWASRRTHRDPMLRITSIARPTFEDRAGACGTTHVCSWWIGGHGALLEEQ